MIDFVHLPGGPAIPILGEIGDDQRITWYDRCQICGCTELDCQGCIDRTGRPCSWANPQRTLCTACVRSLFQQAAVSSPEDCTP